MAKKVFISYRRDDSRYQARMLYTAFTQMIPREHVFMDIDSIPLGSDFRKILKGWVNECDVLLALIGSGWISATDPRTGQPRLMSPGDFVRIEIAEALARNIPVVPVLLDGAHLPDPEQLPQDLKELVYRHAEFVEFARFDDDVARLVRRLHLAGDKVMPSAAAATPQSRNAIQRTEEIKGSSAIGYPSSPEIRTVLLLTPSLPTGWNSQRETATIEHWHVNDSSNVRNGQKLVTFRVRYSGQEIELRSPQDGKLKIELSEGTTVESGKCVGRIVILPS